MSDTTANFPAGDPIDKQGNLTPQWRMFFLSLFTRTGGASGANVLGIQALLDQTNKTLAGATANIGDLQADAAAGVPAADLAAVYALIHMVEAMAAQALAVGPLLDRIAELEARMEAVGSGLPAPAGYAPVRISGMNRQIPYY